MTKKTGHTVQITHVSPLASNSPRHDLSYFSMKKYTPGTIVSIPVRSKVVSATVIGSSSPESLKSELRSSDFALKKVVTGSERFLITSTFLETMKQCAEIHAAPIGAVLNEFIPDSVLESPWKLTEEPVSDKSDNYEMLAVQADSQDRYAYYKSIVRELFALKRSIVVLAPSSIKAEYIYNYFSKGIDRYVFVIHNGLKKKEQLIRWQNALKEEHPVVIIITSSFLSIPRRDIGAIIIEEEGSRMYKKEKRPHVDIRICTELYSRQLGIKYVVGDTLLRPETIHKERRGEAEAPLPLKMRHLSSAENTLIKMGASADGNNESFIISPDLEQSIKSTLEDEENVFLFASRRGIATLTVCNDCGKARTCEHCGATLVLHEKRKERFFVCHTCGTKEEARDTCPNCGGNRLSLLGITAERTKEAIENKFPDARVFIFTGDEIKNEKQAEAILSQFYSTPGSILVGTEMALTRLHTKVSTVAAVSLDPLFAIPDFRMGERVARMILNLRSVANKRIILQTRLKDTNMLENILSGNMFDFIDNTLKMRETLNYPPFTDLIRIRITAPKKDAVDMMKNIQENCSGDIDVFPSFLPAPGKNVTLSALIRLDAGLWPKAEILAFLMSLPQSVDIDVHPTSLT